MGEGKHIWKIPSFSVLLLTVVASIVGLATAGMLHIQYAPAAQSRNVTVSCVWPDASPENVESKVVSLLEGALSSVRSCSRISSQSDKGSGSVTLSFPRKTDMEVVRFEIASCVRNIYSSFPPGVTYPSISLGISGRRSKAAMNYLFKSSLPSKEIDNYISERVLMPLSSLEGVDNVNVSGMTPFEWVITFDETAAETAGVSAEDIAAAVENWSSVVEIGTAHSSSGTMAVRLQAVSSDDFDDIPVKKVGDRVIYLRDIAKSEYKEALPQSYYRLNGLNTITLSVTAASGVNMISVCAAVRDKMEELEKAFPQSISVSLAYDSSEYIAKELNKIYLRTLICVVLLLLFVLIINRSWKYMLMIAVTLTVNLLVAAAVYFFSGINIHIYTFAGITVSLGIIIDTSIIMIDHYGYYHDRSAFFAIFGAVATTVASLLVVLLLPESDKANLVDFIWVIVINLVVSLAVSFYFVPALIDYFPIRSASSVRPVRSRRIVRWSHLYERYIDAGRRHKWVYVVVLVSAFGLPLCLLPESFTSPNGKPLSKAQEFGNKILSWKPYGNNKKVVDNIAGTSFALFYKSLQKGDFYREPSRPELYISAAMPEGCAVGQLNEVVGSMENYLSQFNQIESFTTSVDSYDYALITVVFKPEFEGTSFPDNLKALVTSSAINFGGATWRIWGVNDSYFNNDVVTQMKSDRVRLTGYNYEELLSYGALLVDRLKTNPRVSGPEIWGDGWRTVPSAELCLGYDFEKMASLNLTPYGYYRSLSSKLYDNTIGSIMTDGRMTDVRLESSALSSFDLWRVLNSGIKTDSVYVKLSDVGSIVKRKTELPISKDNQSYIINVCFDFVGSYQLAEKVLKESSDYMNNEVLPVGYKATVPAYNGGSQEKGRYAWLILLVVAVIFVICSMMFNSLRYPFAVIGIIPVSFIGIFLSFGLTDFTFDQGGFASFVMVAGLVVNAGIYLIVAFRSDPRPAPLSAPLSVPQFASRVAPQPAPALTGTALSAPSSVLLPAASSAIHSCPSVASQPTPKPIPSSDTRKYVKAFNHKIIPITLTVISTVLGLIPFLFDGPTEVFWFAFAIGTISGMLFSFLSVIFCLPIFLLPKHPSHKL